MSWKDNSAMLRVTVLFFQRTTVWFPEPVSESSESQSLSLSLPVDQEYGLLTTLLAPDGRRHYLTPHIFPERRINAVVAAWKRGQKKE